MKRLLVIEDDSTYRQMLKRALQGENYTVIEAPNGKIGTQLFFEDPCDLVITDLFMPEKEGIETILELKKRFPDVKIIAISGGGLRGMYAGKTRSDTALEAAKHFGADHALLKPFALEHLLRLVEQLSAPV